MKKSIKIIFWLLIAANVIFFTVMKAGIFDDAQLAQAKQTLHEEKIILLGASAPAAQSAVVLAESAVAPVPATVEPASCFEWGEFSGAELEQVRNALKKLQPGGKLASREIDRNIGYWVYIAPLKDKADISQKLAQLKARGVTDYFVVQEPGEWLNAISLGLFKTRESAQNFLEGLRAKDVRTAQNGERASKNKATVLIINGLDTEMSERLAGLQKIFSESALKRVSCH